MNQKHPTTTTRPTVSPSLTLPILLMVMPLIILVVVFLLYALLNLVIPDSSTHAQLFEGSTPLKNIISVILFLFGAICVFFGPISFVVGLIILIMRLNKRA